MITNKTILNSNLINNMVTIKSKIIEKVLKNRVPSHILLEESKLKRNSKTRPIKYEGLSKEEILKLRKIKNQIKMGINEST